MTHRGSMAELKILPILDEDGYPTRESIGELRSILEGAIPSRADAPARWRRAVDAFYLALTVNHYGFSGPTHKEVRGEMLPLWEYHTGGWSGNEEIVATLSSNLLLWGLLLQRYDAGGHYYFHSPLNSPYPGIRPTPEVVAYLQRWEIRGPALHPSPTSPDQDAKNLGEEVGA